MAKKKVTVFIFLGQVWFFLKHSKLSKKPPPHHPIRTPIRNRRQLFPATTTSTKMADELLICVSQRYLTNVTQIISKTTYDKVSSISCIASCSVVLDEALKNEPEPSCVSALPLCVLSELLPEFTFMCFCCKFVSRPVWRVLAWTWTRPAFPSHLFDSHPVCQDLKRKLFWSLSVAGDVIPQLATV